MLYMCICNIHIYNHIYILHHITLWLGQFPLMCQGKFHHLVPQLNPTTASASHSTDGLQIRTCQLSGADKNTLVRMDSLPDFTGTIQYKDWFTEVLYQFIMPADPSRVGELQKACEKLCGRCWTSCQSRVAWQAVSVVFAVSISETLKLLRGTDRWWDRFKGYEKLRCTVGMIHGCGSTCSKVGLLDPYTTYVKLLWSSNPFGETGNGKSMEMPYIIMVPDL